jgi:hypothetical protein
MVHRYNNNDLNNRYTQQQAEEAFEQSVISKQSLDNIKAAYPCGLYTPNIFIRIALALLCMICVLFAVFLIFVITQANNSSILFLIMFIACYALLEILTKENRYYNAGIDNILQVFSTVFFACISVEGDYGYKDIIICSAIIVASSWFCVRFTDSFMALIAYAALLSCVYYFMNHVTEAAQRYLPFILMLASAIVYALQHWLKGRQSLSFYKKCFNILSTATLVSFYAAGNVYVVNQLSKSFLSLFWIISVLTPVAYIIYGFTKKQLLFLRIGFLALIATIATAHYYYSLLSIEVALIIAGCIFIVLGYMGLNHFKNGRLGFTARSHTALNKELIALETLISIQAGGKHAPTQSVEFGGGSSGGAGASGKW